MTALAVTLLALGCSASEGQAPGTGGATGKGDQSVDAADKAIDVSKRSGGTQISASQAASMRDPAVVLAGWQPPP